MPETVPDTANQVALSQAERTGEGEGVGATVGAGIGNMGGAAERRSAELCYQELKREAPSRKARQPNNR